MTPRFAPNLRTPTGADRAAAAPRFPARAGARGFSLVEAMVSAGIVGVMLVASINLLSSAARTRAADNNRRAGLMLAQQLMSEVQQLPYKDDSLLGIAFGPELLENGRSDYDDVDDYRNYNEKPPVYRNGSVITDYTRWQRKVRVYWVYPDSLAEAPTDTGLVKIEVRAQDPRGVETVVYALRAERAVPADPPVTGTTYVTAVEVELQVDGAPPRHVITGALTPARPVTPN